MGFFDICRTQQRLLPRYIVINWPIIRWAIYSLLVSYSDLKKVRPHRIFWDVKNLKFKFLTNFFLFRHTVPFFLKLLMPFLLATRWQWFCSALAIIFQISSKIDMCSPPYCSQWQQLLQFSRFLNLILMPLH